MTRNEWINKLQNETRVPRWLIDEIWGDADIDILVECETEKDYKECLEELKNDVELRIAILQEIKVGLDNIPFEKPKR